MKPQTAELKPQSLELKPKTRELKPRAEAQERRAEAISYSIRSSFSSRLRNMFIVLIKQIIIEWPNDWVCNYKTMKAMKLQLQHDEISDMVATKWENVWISGCKMIEFVAPDP